MTDEPNLTAEVPVADVTLWRSLTDVTPVAHVPLATALYDTSLRHAEKAASRLWTPAVVPERRLAANVTALSYLVFDLDSGPVEAGRLSGISAAWHRTHSSTAERPKARLIVALSRPVLPGEFRRLWPFARTHLAPSSDPACKDLARAFYLPPPGAEVQVNPGAPLDVTAWLAAAPEPSVSAPTGEVSERIVDPESVPQGAKWDGLVEAWARVWPERGRHELVQCIAGTLGRGSWPDDDIARFCVEVSERAGAPDDGIRDADLTSRDRLRRLADGESGYGVPRLRDLVDTFGLGQLDALAYVDALVSAAGRTGLTAWAAERAREGETEELDGAPADPVAPRAPDPRAACRDRRTRPRGFWLEVMNAHFTLLTDLNGKIRVMSWRRTELGLKPSFQTVPDFKLRFQPHKAHVEGLEESVSIGTWWLNQDGRREAHNLTFRPDRPEEFVDGDLNTWRGYGVEARQGDWSRMRAHIREIICAGDETVHTYVLRWLAWTVQNPGLQAEVALVLRGAKGCGKNSLLDVVCDMFGSHALTVTNPRHLTGNFNGHLHSCAFLFANEAVPPGDKASESVLKGLVTDDRIALERKGIDTEQAPNCLTIAMATNERWAVPASEGERRFCVVDVSGAQCGNTQYFNALWRELESGGREAMLHDLLAERLPDGWHPRQDIPKTTALVEQQTSSLRGGERAVFGLLESGDLPNYEQPGDGSDGIPGPGWVFVVPSLWLDDIRKEQKAPSKNALTRALLRAGGVKGRVRLGFGQRRGVWLPPLSEARATWSKSFGMAVPWDDADGVWV